MFRLLIGDDLPYPHELAHGLLVLRGKDVPAWREETGYCLSLPFFNFFCGYGWDFAKRSPPADRNKETRVSSLARVAAVPMSSTVPSHSVAFGNGMMSGRLTSPRPAGPNSHSHVRTERTFSLKDNQESGRLSLSEEGEIVNDCRESGRLSVRSYALSGLSKATRKRLPKGQEGPSKKKSCHVLQVTGYRFSPSIRSARTFSL